ncbi:MAG TPA: RNA polymerase sigma factor [Bradyrhizobium sp.]|nr:RNA polymerase sigma factor [Bradyrhizobium sp.]
MTGLVSPPSERAERLTQLLHRVSASDTRAFCELHALTRNKMRKTAFAAGASSGDIDDILQEGYLKIWRNAGSFDRRRASAIAWMCTIMRNAAIDMARARKLPTSDLGEACTAVCDDSLDCDDFDYERIETIAFRALKRLPEDRRKLIALAYIEGESRSTLSQHFGVPVGTIKTWLHRTLRAVREDCIATAQSVGAMEADAFSSDTGISATIISKSTATRRSKFMTVEPGSPPPR